MSIYLDHAASTPVDPRVAAAMREQLEDPGLQANPSAVHAGGRYAAARIERARSAVAALIGAAPEEIIWTSGATEANNLAILGAARFRAVRGRHLVSCPAEHPSVTGPLKMLEREGFGVSWLGTDALGVVDPATVAAALRPETTLVSIMMVNNETGVMQDIAAIAAHCRARGVLLHVDAVQAAGREPIDVCSIGADLLSISAHKMYGPKGVGVLYVNAERAHRILPLFAGGSQERGLRPGTVPTHQVVGMGVAAELAGAQLLADRERLRSLRDALWEGLRTIPGLHLNGHPGRRACHILNFSVEGVEGESLGFGLGTLECSQGSSCLAERGEPSQVLRLLGRTPELARSALRFSVGRTTTAAEVASAVALTRDAITRLRRLSPAVAAT